MSWVKTTFYQDAGTHFYKAIKTTGEGGVVVFILFILISIHCSGLGKQSFGIWPSGTYTPLPYS